MRADLEKVDSVYAFWGRWPKIYDAQDYATFLGRPGLIRQRAVQKLQLNIGEQALEVACGTGRNFQYLHEAVGNSGAFVGFDYSREMFSAAQRLCEHRGWHNVELVQGDAAGLSVRQRRFDGVLSVLGMSAVPDWEKPLSRCHDVLKTGGRLSICDAQPFRGLFSVLNPFIKYVYSRGAAWNPATHIPEKMHEIFGNVEVEEFNGGSIFIAVSSKK